jgi:hypothetical protein
MTTIDNIMVLADSYAAVSAVSTMAHAVEVRAELVTALTEALAAQPVREPLSDDVIFKIAYGTADEMWPGVGGVGWTKDDAKFYGIFCKKIEQAHGIGGDK